MENGHFWTENSLFQRFFLRATGNAGFLDPETLFSRKWRFGPLSGVGGIAVVVFLLRPPMFICVMNPF